MEHFLLPHALNTLVKAGPFDICSSLRMRLLSQCVKREKIAISTFSGCLARGKTVQLERMEHPYLTQQDFDIQIIEARN